MIKKILLLALLAFAPSAHAQTPITSPQVLGCISPAPAVPPATTVWLSSGCKTPAYLPLSTTSVVASVSKTAPVWAHTLTGYPASALVVACPIGAIVSGSSCTSSGIDVSALVAQSSVATFSLPPPPPPAPAIVDVTITFPGSPSVTWKQVEAGACFTITDGTHLAQECAPTK